MNTVNFILREWQLSDAQSIAENLNNINIWNNVRDYLPFPYTEKDGEEFITAVLDNKMGIQRAIVVDRKVVGCIGVFPKSDVERINCELGYWIGEQYWNKGIVSEAVKQFSSYLFENYDFIKIFATPFGFNTASQRVLQKAGFECEGVLKRAAIKNGEITDFHYYSLFK